MAATRPQGAGRGSMLPPGSEPRASSPRSTELIGLLIWAPIVRMLIATAEKQARFHVVDRLLEVRAAWGGARVNGRLSRGYA